MQPFKKHGHRFLDTPSIQRWGGGESTTPPPERGRARDCFDQWRTAEVTLSHFHGWVRKGHTAEGPWACPRISSAEIETPQTKCTAGLRPCWFTQHRFLSSCCPPPSLPLLSGCKLGQGCRSPHPHTHRRHGGHGQRRDDGSKSDLTSEASHQRASV